MALNTNPIPLGRLQSYEIISSLEVPGRGVVGVRKGFL